MKKFHAAVAVAALGICAGVQAQDFPQGYIGINYALPEQNDRFFGSDKFDTGDVFVRLGGHLNDIFDGELRLGTTISEKTGNGREFSHEYLAGLFLRAGYDIGIVRPYLTVGLIYGKERLELATGGRATDTFDDVSYGAGVDVGLGERLGLNIEYTQYYDIGNVTMKGPSAGVFWRY